VPPDAVIAAPQLLQNLCSSRHTVPQRAQNMGFSCPLGKSGLVKKLAFHDERSKELFQIKKPVRQRGQNPAAGNVNEKQLPGGRQTDQNSAKEDWKNKSACLKH